jgi:hypothetical protein
LILGVVVAVLLIPQAALALCLQQPFDAVVRSSDAVLVGTVTGAGPMPPHRSGIVVGLDVQQVLKGSAADGRAVVIRSCGPVVTGSMAKAMAKQMIGTGGIFLLTVDGNGMSYQYSDITTPQNMTLDQKIAEARRVLGLGPGSLPHDSSSPYPWEGVVLTFLALVGVGVVVAGAVFLVRRARRA